MTKERKSTVNKNSVLIKDESGKGKSGKDMSGSRDNKAMDKNMAAGTADRPQPVNEYGGRGGLDPARYGDWEVAGKCVDF